MDRDITTLREAEADEHRGETLAQRFEALLSSVCHLGRDGGDTMDLVETVEAAVEDGTVDLDDLSDAIDEGDAFAAESFVRDVLGLPSPAGDIVCCVPARERVAS